MQEVSQSSQRKKVPLARNRERTRGLGEHTEQTAVVVGQFESSESKGTFQVISEADHRGVCSC